MFTMFPFGSGWFVIGIAFTASASRKITLTNRPLGICARRIQAMSHQTPSLIACDASGTQRYEIPSVANDIHKAIQHHSSSTAATIKTSTMISMRPARIVLFFRKKKFIDASYI
jgi:hypothetical protein